MRDAIPFGNCMETYRGTSALHNDMVYIVTFFGSHLASYDIKSQQFQCREIVGLFPKEYFYYYYMPSLVSCGGKLLLVARIKLVGVGDEHEHVGDNHNTWSCSLISISPHGLIQSSLFKFEIMVAATSENVAYN